MPTDPELNELRRELRALGPHVRLTENPVGAFARSPKSRPGSCGVFLSTADIAALVVGGFYTRDGTALVRLKAPASTRKLVRERRFIRAWQRSQHVQEVADRLGISYSAAWNRALRLRNAGIPLRRFKPGRPPRVRESRERLVALALHMSPAQ